jgi:DNA modification methylase
MTVRILHGDCRERLRDIPAASVHCCVTSPPYFGLRDYGTGSWEGGDASCPHVRIKDRGRSTIDGGGYQSREVYRDRCSKCGAQRVDCQIGLESDPMEFVDALVEVFREVRRALRDDGTLWLNIGDSYATGTKAGRPAFSPTGRVGANHQGAQNSVPRIGTPDGCKTKDLIGIPWMLAFALRADGWFLRQDIIWSKPNPMPESVRDRCTKAHEYLFLMSKSARYYFDADAIAEPLAASSIPRLQQNLEAQEGTTRAHAGAKTNGNLKAQGDLESGKRNKRSVWEVTTQPFKAAHFATYPPALVEPCILAGCPKGGTVLDPFFGAGTTGLVADRLHRDCIGIELNPDYAGIAQRRIAAESGIFGSIAVEGIAA